MPEQITIADYNRLSQLIASITGIVLTEDKKVMLESRLSQRLRELGIPSFEEYANLVLDDRRGVSERAMMVDLMTTNKTSFFRESAHFEFLRNEYLPGMLAQNQKAFPLRIWSAACSSGEEVYSIIMTVEDFFADRNETPLPYKVWGSDLSSIVLEKASKGIYQMDKVEHIPYETKKRYFLKHRNPEINTVRLKPELRAKAQFQQLNFMSHDYGFHEQFDLVFCRNVLIYFERDVQQQVVNKICRYLKPSGLLLTGHAESLLNMQLPLKQLKPAIYQKLAPSV